MAFPPFDRILLIQTALPLFLLSFLIPSANGETYKWIDDKGVMGFSDDLSSVPSKYRNKITNSSYTSEPANKSSHTRTRKTITANPVIKENYDYYEIIGRTEKELQQQMNASGIIGADGNSYYAYTNWYVRWNYTFKSTPTSCSIDTVASSVDVKYKLPKWVSYKDAPANLKNKWDHFIQNLVLHEYGHKDIGAQTAGEIERAIAALKPHSTCRELELAANSIGRQLLDKSKPIEADYDLRTRHGRTQGANFP